MPKKRKVKRARDAAGHFVKRKKARRAKPAKRHKAAGRKRAVVRVKRALGRKRSNGRFVKRGKHRVRGYRRKVAGRSRKKLVRAHMSYENPVKRKRRSARRSQEETVTMSENPRRRRRRRTGKARRRHHSVAENPRKRSKKRRSPARRRARRRASVTASVPAVIRRRRKSGRKARTTRSPGTIKVVIAGLGRRGGSRSRKRRASPSRKRKHARKRRKSHRRSYSGGYTPRSHQLAAASMESGLFENPLGGYTLENPLSGGELALAGLTGAIGFVVGDMLDRYLAVRQYAPATVPTGATALAPAQAVATAPSMMRILAQAALAAAPLAGAYYTHRPMAKAALQGLGLGVLFRLGGQLINQFIVTKYIAPGTGTVGTFVGPLYQDETQAGTAAAASNLAGLPLGLGAPPAPQRQQPRALGAPRVLARPSIPYKGDPGPRAVAAAPAGVGNCSQNPDCDDTNMDGSPKSAPIAPYQGSGSNSSSSPALNGVPAEWFPDT